LLIYDSYFGLAGPLISTMQTWSFNFPLL